MGDFIQFTPRSKDTANQNLANFINHARTQLHVFGEDLDFDQNEWDISKTVVIKGEYHKVSLLFTNKDSTRLLRMPMREPFLSFAKAYVRYTFGLKVKKDVGTSMVALRALEAALVLNTGEADPTLVDANILNCAARVMGERVRASTAYRIGVHLAKIGSFMCAHRLTATLDTWKNPIKSPPLGGNRVGKNYDQERMEKMPTPTVLDALPRIFREATEPGDVVTSSACALMCSAPDRVNEVMLLREVCEIEQRDKEGKISYGLRWWPAKGADPQIKWIVNSMSVVVKEALVKIRNVTEGGRELAKWYEKNPGRLYLPKHLEHLRSQEWLSLEEVGDIVFSSPVGLKSSRQWCRQHGVEVHKFTSRSSRALFSEVETAVIKLLPFGFPIMNDEIGLKYSEALFLCNLNLLHLQKGAYRCMFEPISSGHVAARLRSGDNSPSMFERFGFSEPDGSAIHVASHQFRHYLNTLAQSGGLSQLDIAKWSGRKDLRQNAAYDHQSRESLLIKMRAAIGDDKQMIGPLAGRSISIVSRAEFASLKFPTAHTTDFGYCVHDYVMSPCPLNGGCIDCEELVCIKGEVDKEKKIRQSLAEAELLLLRAQAAVEKNEFGAAEWLEVHCAKTKRLRALVEVFDNPAVAEGAFIHQAAPQRPSRMEHAHYERMEVASPFPLMDGKENE